MSLYCFILSWMFYIVSKESHHPRAELLRVLALELSVTKSQKSLIKTGEASSIHQQPHQKPAAAFEGLISNHFKSCQFISIHFNSFQFISRHSSHFDWIRLISYYFNCRFLRTAEMRVCPASSPLPSASWTRCRGRMGDVWCTAAWVQVALSAPEGTKAT